MKKFSIVAVAVSLLYGLNVCRSQESPRLPEPKKEHAWLQNLVGDWETESEIFLVPGESPLKSSGTESVRKIGGFWILAEDKGELFGRQYTGLMTLGYNASKKKYVGTRVDSMTSYLWTYEGTLDDSGKVLTLETEGPSPNARGTRTRFENVIELKSKDHNVLSSSMQGKDGKWTKIMTINYRRKK